jgi:transglutaminase-like putative cysteine protease
MSSLIDQKYAEWTAGLDPEQARIVLFERVRDIPYAYPASRDPEEVLRTGVGTCSGKHYLLAELYRRLGLQVRSVICSHRFNESDLPFPEAMQAMLRKNEIVDMHDYVQIEVGGDWVDIDATWELGLRDFGFPVTEDWDGRAPMMLSVAPDEQVVVDNGDAARTKEEMLAKLSPRQRSLRKQFLDALNRWMVELAPEIERGA